MLCDAFRNRGDRPPLSHPSPQLRATMSKSSFVHAMQQQQNAHDPGASQLSSIHSHSSAHVNQIQGDSSAQGKMLSLIHI